VVRVDVFDNDEDAFLGKVQVEDDFIGRVEISLDKVNFEYRYLVGGFWWISLILGSFSFPDIGFGISVQDTLHNVPFF